MKIDCNIFSKKSKSAGNNPLKLPATMPKGEKPNN